MKKIFSALLVTFTFLGLTAIAQTRTITGKVTSSDGKAITGVSVSVKGQNAVVVSSEGGNYSISANGAVTLVFSSVGFTTKEVAAGAGQNSLNVILLDETTQLSEVLVTGYSTQRKKDITGAVSVVKVAELISQPVGNAESALQGLASGVTVTSSGQPGDGASVRIRGFGSLSAGNSPLYIVDGIPTDNLSDINANDIESLQVLKDAAAAAQYGARASNGVIIITTKRGQKTGIKVTFDSYYGIQTQGKGFDLLSPQGNADLTWLAYKNSGQLTNGNPQHPQYGNGASPVLPDYILAGALSGVKEGNPAANPNLYKLDMNNTNAAYLIVKANKAGTNWYDEVFDAAPQTNHNLTMSGGNANSKFYVGLNYFDQKGTVMTTFYKRYTVRANSEFNIKNKVRIGENLQLSYSNNIKIGNQSEGNEISLSYRIQPIVPVYDIKGNFAGQKGAGLGNALNPVAYRKRAQDNRGNDWKILGNVYMEADLLKNVMFRTSFGGEQSLYNYYYFNFKTYENSENNTSNGYAEGSGANRSWTFTNTLSYKNTFKEKHNLTALIGTEAIDSWGRYMSASRGEYFVEDPNFRSLNTGSGIQTNEGAPYPKRSLFSVFAKSSYNFDDRFYADVTVRRDGSSVFGDSNRYAIFPAGSAGWRMSQESFMRNLNWISDFKVRGSWGQMGNQGINPDNAFSTYGGSLGGTAYDLGGTSNSALAGFAQTRIGNPFGKWETNTTTNIGFDGQFFKGALELVFDWYSKKTSDLLYVAPLVNTTQGDAAAPAVNIASMENKGIDLALTYRGQKNKWRYTVTGTFTTYDNKITGLAENVDYFQDGGYRQGNFVRNQIGHPVSAFYGYQVIGFFKDANDVKASPVQQEAAIGRFKYQDIDGDKQITDKDRTFLGDPNPDFTYGLNLALGYENFDMSAFFYGVQGKSVVNYTSWWTDYFSSFQGGKSTAALSEAWTASNQNARLPIVENSSNFSNQAVFNSSLIEDGSYLRLKNLILGYTLPKNKLGNSGIEKLRFYLQASNVLTFTKYRGLDPEFRGNDTAFGIDYGNYPNQKQFYFGVNLTF